MAESLDRIKDLTFRYAARSGLTISIDDVKTPPSKADIIARYEAEAQKAETQFKRGIITDDERRQKEIEIWTSANSEVGKAMEDTLHAIQFNPLDMMVDSGARGNPQQVRQIAGMKGLVSNPRGEMIPRPILSSFREGLSVLEYFISTHGARKGLADTALRTADSGYLDPPAGRRGPGADRSAEGLRDDPGIRIGDIQPDDETVAGLPGDPHRRPGAGPRRHPVRRGGAAGRYGDLATDHGRPARRSFGDRDHGPFGPHVRGRARRVRRLLRPLAGHQPPHRARRGGRGHRGPVHRRARHAADHAYLPHRGHRR